MGYNLDPKVETSLCDVLHFVNNSPRVLPGNEKRIACLAYLSSILLNDPNGERYKQFKVLGFWLRKASLARLAQQFDKKNMVHVPRGVALHFPPENVDTLFVYSWALSYLSGNSNICRMPEHLSDSTDWLVNKVKEALAKHDDDAGQLFEYFPKDDSTVAALSSCADVRVIWGGDEKIRKISQFPTRVDGLTLPFSSRKSISVIAVEQYRNASDEDKKLLAKKLYNDAYWFDQMACGSPSTICWVGKIHQELLDDFHSYLLTEIKTQGYSVDTHVDIRNFVTANVLVANQTAKSGSRVSNGLIMIESEEKSSVALDYGNGGGFFVHQQFDNLSDLATLKSRMLQTVGTFGLTLEDKTMIAQLFAGEGVFRIVEIGNALSFGPIWDGVDLLSSLTRRVVVEG